MLAVTLISETFTRRELQRAVKVAAALGVKHLVVKSDELDYRPFIRNNPDRCYHCKYLRLSRLKKIARDKGYQVVAEGSNLDDNTDHRPGMMAVRRLDVKSPLQQAGLTKAEVRQISKMWGLPTWNAPSQSCLATRIPYGQPITPRRLQRIAEAEELLLNLGFTQVRVRDHGDIARIEVLPQQVAELISNKEYICRHFEAIGYTYVTVDLNGFSSGSMNKAINQNRDGEK
ncbi:uncharacterized protein JOC37_001709 [Desulfohalotomaculum tongense]|nr:uncharacterized protein [Desulforadius tongensis]